MATIIFSLSTKRNSDGKNRVLVRFYEGKINRRGKTGIFADGRYWDNTKGELTPPRLGKKIRTAEEEKTVEEIRRVNAELSRIKSLIMESYYHCVAGHVALTKEWLNDLLSEQYGGRTDDDGGDALLSAMDTFIESRDFSESRIAHYRVTRNELKRFSVMKGKSLSFAAIDEDFIIGFERFLEEEYKYVEVDESGEKEIRDPLYRKAFEEAPNSRLPELRSKNTIINKLHRLHTFFNWAYKKGLCEKDPFANFRIGTEIYGDPICISAEERDLLYHADFSSYPSLAVQRDIFVFHCFIGCRVGDYFRLTKQSYWDGAIHYIANKTKKRTGRSIIIPITKEIPLEILERYRDIPGDKLLPFISQQRYNDSIKEMIRKAGIDRKILVLNPQTREEEPRMLSEMASSHMARRTFNNCLLHNGVSDSVAATLMGQKTNSRAAERYRFHDAGVLREATSKL